MKKVVPWLVFLVVFLCSCCCVTGVFVWGVASNPSLIFRQKDLGVKTNPDIARQIYKDIGFVNGLESLSTDDILVDNIDIEVDQSLVVDEVVIQNPDKLIFTGTTKVNRVFTSEEVSSWVELVSQQWNPLPFKSPQILIHPNGMIEVSSMLSIFRAQEFALQLGYTVEEIEAAKEFLSIFSGDIPIYMSGNVEVVNNEVTLNLESLDVIGYRPPTDVVEGFEVILTNLAERVISMVTGLDIQELKVEEDGIKYNATIPKEVSIER
jgi:hypothetical protein